MTLTQLRALIAIADCDLNITVAAERLNGTQPGLSKQIKQLEDELGFLVFTRGARSLDGITPAGAKVIDHARLLLVQANNIKALADNLRQRTDGELRIATTHTQARFALPLALASFNRRFPGIAVHLFPGSDAESLAKLDRDEVDFAIISTAGSEAPGGYIALPIYRWDRIIVVPQRHALAMLAGKPSLSDLSKQPLVSYESSMDPASSLRQAFSREGLAVNMAMTARDADLIKTYVRAGFGVGILAEMAYGREDADLLRIDADGLLPQCTTWLLVRKDRVLRDYTGMLIQRLIPALHSTDLKRLMRCEQPVLNGAAPHWRENIEPGSKGEFEI
jgi:LysR family transcriptional regulator, cys regulon transcriptional activator